MSLTINIVHREQRPNFSRNNLDYFIVEDSGHLQVYVTFAVEVLINIFPETFLFDFLDFDVDYEARAESIFDVLGTAVALQDSLGCQDADLGRERFSFVHHVGSQNYGAGPVLLDFCDHLPHEAA